MILRWMTPTNILSLLNPSMWMAYPHLQTFTKWNIKTRLLCKLWPTYGMFSSLRAILRLNLDSVPRFNFNFFPCGRKRTKHEVTAALQVTSLGNFLYQELSFLKSFLILWLLYLLENPKNACGNFPIAK